MVSRLRPVVAVLGAAATLAVVPSAAQAAPCSLLSGLLGCREAAPPTAPSTTPSAPAATTCTALARLLGCRPSSGAAPTDGAQAPTLPQTCTAVQRLLGCKAGAPAAPPASTVRPDGSLDLKGADGGLQPLPPHDPRATLPEPLFPRVGGHLPFGFNGWRQSASFRSLARLASGAGAKVARISIDWPGVEGKQGQFYWAVIDDLYREHVQRGVRPLWVLLNTPRPYVASNEATMASCGGNLLFPGYSCKAPPAPAHLGRFGEFARRVAVRYPLAAGLEVWNEPNIKRFWRPYPDPVRYASVVKAVWEAVKQPARADGSGGRPAMRVLAGGTANSAYSNSQGWADVAFVREALNAGMGDWMDGLSLHVFPYDPDEPLWAASFARIQDELATRPEPWVANTRLALTETGLSTGITTPVSVGQTEAEQARGLTDLYKQLDAAAEGTPGRGRVDLFIVHTLEDHVSQGDEMGFGSLAPQRPDGRWVAKLAWCSLRRHAGGILGPAPQEVVLGAVAARECGVTGVTGAARIRR